MVHFELMDILAPRAGNCWCGVRRGVFAGICTDTRTLRAGELFVALRGERFDGLNFRNRA